MNIIELIKQNYGDSCQLHSGLTNKQYEKAKKQLPAELCEILKISNGINEVMINSQTNEIMVIDSIIYSLSEIKSETKHYKREMDGEGFVFADNGAGDFYVLKPDGHITIYVYCDLSESYVADSLYEFFK